MNVKAIAFYALIFTTFPFKNSFAGMANYSRWDIPEINVCFAEKDTEYYVGGFEGPKRDWKQREKEELQKVLEEEYTPARTGYTFVGFKDCNETDEINVVVGVRAGLSAYSVAGVKGVATTGMGGRRTTSYEDARGAVVLSPMGVSKTTIVHEFGHILGLKHEHLHPNARAEAGGICPYYTGDAQLDRATIYTDFDKQSVMNYCHIFGLKGRNAGLSEKDMELLLDIFNKKHLFNPWK